MAKSAVKPLSQTELQIGDKIYEVEGFIKKHPGVSSAFCKWSTREGAHSNFGSVGTVIKSKLGCNATQAFNEFHLRSKRATKVLAALPSRRGFPQEALLNDFDALRAEFVKEGLFRFSPIHVIYRILEIALMTIGGYMLVLRGWYWTGLFILGITSGRCGWIQHEANHNSLTGNMKIDKFIGSFFFSVGEAGSATWWISSHNRHHASPQHLGYDSDLNTLPAMAFDAVTARLGRPSWLKFQAFTFVPSVAFVVLYWKLYLHPLAIVRKKAIMDGLFLVLHYVAWWHFFKHLGIGGAIFAHLVWGSVAGAYLFTHFAMSHTHKEVILHEQNEDWVRSAILRTTNIKHNLLVNWVMGYLNLQIEHHLFPNMPQFRHPRCVDRIKALCKKHNLPYDERGYWETLWTTFRNLHDVGHGQDVGVDRRKKRATREQKHDD